MENTYTYTHDTHSTDWILLVQNMSLVKLITSKDDNPTICDTANISYHDTIIE